jgi:hypothetical protein
MPFILRLIAVVSPLGTLAVISSFIPFPFGSYSIDGRIVTFQEWWRSGSALLSISAGLFLIAMGIGIYKRRRWAQKLILAYLVVADILILRELPTAPREELDGIILTLIFSSLLIVWYTFFKKNVRNYFA